MMSMSYRRYHMLAFSGLIAVLCCASFCIASSEGEAGEHVVTLTTKNFDSFLEENPISIIEFYAPWCGHCKKFAPEYETAAKKLKETGSTVKLGKVDATAENALADKYGVKGYPTLYFFKNKVHQEFSGKRNAEYIVEWLSSMTGPAVELIDAASVRKLTESKPGVAFVGHFKSKTSDLFTTYEKVADANRQIGKFVAQIGADKDQIVVVRGDEENVAFTGKTVEELSKFVTEESFPLFGPINGENFKNYAERSQEIVWFCGEEKEFEEVKGAVRDAAKKYREELSFVWLDTEQFKGHAENALGVTEFPTLVYQSKKGRFIIPDKAHAKDSAKVIKFFEDVKAGKVEKNLKSEPIPESQDDSVKVVVGKNFEDLVLQADKDVMLEVYAPWCGHCKKLEPIYKELADSLKQSPHIVIAKMDGTANESPVEDFDWTGFPTIFFVKAGTKTPMKFDGPRTLEGLTEYISKHASKPISQKVSDEL